MFIWTIILSVGLLGLLFFWPRFGLVSRWRQVRRLSARVLREDALKHIYNADIKGGRPTLQSVAGTLHLHADRAADLLADMEKRGLLTFVSGELQLTPPGRAAALHIIRAHRLWESYLAEETGVAESQWHQQAEQREHHLSLEQVNALSAQLGDPTHDPHGDPIPTAAGAVAAEKGESLNTLSVDRTALISHIEDEPATIYAQIVAEGLRPGMKLRVLEKSAQAIRFWADGNEHVLAPIFANNISVMPVAPAEVEEEPEFLTNLEPGQKARVLGLSRVCRGAERRRLLDLGFVPGSEVEVEMISPLGDPTAYRVRGTVIALRRDQARLIRVTAPEPVNA